MTDQIGTVIGEGTNEAALGSVSVSRALVYAENNIGIRSIR
jgi:hypothetical protein